MVYKYNKHVSRRWDAHFPACNHHSYKHIQQIPTSLPTITIHQRTILSSLTPAVGRIPLCTRWCCWPREVIIKLCTRKVRGFYIRALGHTKFNGKYSGNAYNIKNICKFLFSLKTLPHLNEDISKRKRVKVLYDILTFCKSID